MVSSRWSLAVAIDSIQLFSGQCSVLGIWCLVLGIWCLVLRILFLVLGIWSVVGSRWSVGSGSRQWQ